MKPLDLLRGALLALTAALLPAAPLCAFQEEGGGEEGQDAKPVEEESDKDVVLAIVHADIHTGTGEVLRDASLLARNGKIRRIGYDLYIPPEAKVLDVRGMRVYPGLVAIGSRGLIGSSTSDFDDTIDPFSAGMVLGLAGGITSTGIGNSAVKLKRFSVEGVTLREKAYATLSYSARNPSSKRTLREKLVRTSEYLREYRDWEERVKKDKELKEPSKRGVDTSVLSVLRGEVLAKFNANDRDDLLGIARLAQEFGFRPVIEGCREGWTVADELGRAGAMAIVTPRDRQPKDESLVRPGGTSIENAALLHHAGVPVAVVPANEGVDLSGMTGRDIMNLPIEAGFAVRGGLPEDAALAAITIVPARMMGIAHRVGTLEVGKDCDLIVTDGDVMHYQTFVQWAVVDGKVVYDKEKELFFAHIRPRPAPPAAAPELDRGETAVKPPEEGAGEEPPEDKPEDEPKEKKDGEDGEKKDGDGEGGGGG